MSWSLGLEVHTDSRLLIQSLYLNLPALQPPPTGLCMHWGFHEKGVLEVWVQDGLLAISPQFSVVRTNHFLSQLGCLPTRGNSCCSPLWMCHLHM